MEEARGRDAAARIWEASIGGSMVWVWICARRSSSVPKDPKERLNARGRARRWTLLWAMSTGADTDTSRGAGAAAAGGGEVLPILESAEMPWWIGGTEGGGGDAAGAGSGW